MSKEELAAVYKTFANLRKEFGSISPGMVSNPETLASMLKDFVLHIVGTDWANVPCHGESLSAVFRRIKGDARPKQVTFEPTVFEQPTPMEVDHPAVMPPN